MEDWSGSSIDGSLDDGLSEFNSSNVVASAAIEGEKIYTLNKRDDVDNIALLMPSCIKLNGQLHNAGYSPIVLTSKDIDANRRSVSVFVIDAYIESISSCVAELLDHQLSAQANVSAVSFGMVKSEGLQNTLQDEVSRLQDKLNDALRREKSAEQKKENAEKECDALVKQMSELNMESKRKIKSMESLIQEAERKYRQREVEFERMRDKVQAMSSRERESSARQAKAMTMHRRGDSLPDSPASSNSSGTPTRRSNTQNRSLNTSHVSNVSEVSHYSSTSSTRVINKSAALIGGGDDKRRGVGSGGVSMQDVVAALEDERNELIAHTEDLERQLAAATNRLKKLENSGYVFGRGADDGGDGESSVDTPRHRRVRGSDDEDEDMPAQVFSKLQDQSSRIQQLVHQLEMEKRTSLERKEDISVMRTRAKEMQSEIENLRIELDARPSMTQWTAKVKEVAELESKLHNVVMMRDEAAELASWRNHLSTRDRIKADKRNHELKLWLLESLPKTVMKEVLQNICRELDISEISEIHLCISKLKAVVRAVPRMEKFITTVCNFVFQRETPRHAEGDVILKPTMEDALPVLQRWWSCTQDIESLREFEEKVVRALRRVDTHGSSRAFALLSAGGDEEAEDVYGEGRPSQHFKARDEPRSAMYSSAGDMLDRRARFEEALVKIRSLIEFQEEIFRHSQNYSDAQKFMNERPEVLVNSLMGHILYLFGIRNLQGVIPRMNEVYLFTEEMGNFMTNVRQMLNMKTMPDATVLTEIYGRIKLAQTQRNDKNTSAPGVSTSKKGIRRPPAWSCTYHCD